MNKKMSVTVLMIKRNKLKQMSRIHALKSSDMLINCFGQPTLLKGRETYLHEFKNAPLLLCHKNAMEGAILPSDWSGKLIGTQEVLNDIRLEVQFGSASIQRIFPNETYVIELGNDSDLYQYKSKNIEITAIPWNKDYLMFLIKDDNVVNLLTDLVTEDLTVFVQNKILRNVIKSGIDVLYVNDGVYHSPQTLKTYPSDFLLGALVTIVRPRFIKGTDEELPAYFEDCCINHELMRT